MVSSESFFLLVVFLTGLRASRKVPKPILGGTTRSPLFLLRLMKAGRLRPGGGSGDDSELEEDEGRAFDLPGPLWGWLSGVMLVSTDE